MTLVDGRRPPRLRAWTQRALFAANAFPIRGRQLAHGAAATDMRGPCRNTPSPATDKASDWSPEIRALRLAIAQLRGLVVRLTRHFGGRERELPVCAGSGAFPSKNVIPRLRPASPSISRARRVRSGLLAPRSRAGLARLGYMVSLSPGLIIGGQQYTRARGAGTGPSRSVSVIVPRSVGIGKSELPEGRPARCPPDAGGTGDFTPRSFGHRPHYPPASAAINLFLGPRLTVSGARRRARRSERHGVDR